MVPFQRVPWVCIHEGRTAGRRSGEIDAAHTVGREGAVELREGLRIRYQDRAAKVKKIRGGMVCMVYDEEPDSKTWYQLASLNHAMDKGELTVG